MYMERDATSRKRECEWCSISRDDRLGSGPAARLYFEIVGTWLENFLLFPFFFFSSLLGWPCVCVCASLFRRMMMDILVLLVSKERETQKRRARAGPRPATTTERLAGWLAGPITVWSMLAIKRAPRLYRIYCAGPKQKTAAGRKWAW